MTRIESSKEYNDCFTLQKSQSSGCWPDWSLLSIRHQSGFIAVYVNGAQARQRHLTGAALAVNTFLEVHSTKTVSDTQVLVASPRLKNPLNTPGQTWGGQQSLLPILSDRVGCSTFTGFDTMEVSCSGQTVSCKAARQQQLPWATNPRGCSEMCCGLQSCCL